MVPVWNNPGIHTFYTFVRRHIRTVLILLCILGVALFTRLHLLSVIPTGISDDEVLFPLSGRAFFYTAKDLTEQWFPLSLTKPPSNIIQVFGKVPYILFSPFFGMVKFSLFTARLPYALLGSLFVIVLFLIARKLFSTQIGSLIALLYAISPWSILFSRTAYEAPLGVYFAFMMFALLLYIDAWGILLAYPLFVLSLYSYIGTPVVLPFFAGITTLYVWLSRHKKNTLQYLLFLGLSIATLMFYIVRLPYDVGGNKTSQLITPFSQTVAESVNYNRNLTIPSHLTGIFVNKYENFLERFVVQYANAFSPAYLFAQGESQARFSMDSHGPMYLVDAVFLCIGIAALLFHKRRARTYMLLALLFVSPFPSALSGGDAQYVLRSAFMFPILLIVVGYGIYFAVFHSRNKMISLVLIAAVYILSFANFGYLYFYKNPIANYDSFGVSGRIVARYLVLAREHNTQVEILFYGINKGLLKQYLFFANRYTRENHSAIAALYTQNIVHIDTTTFADCVDRSMGSSTIIIPFNFVCVPKRPLTEVLNITNYVNNQPIYVIYNDSICNNYPVSPYVHALTLNNFNIETMGEKQFCQTFFTRDRSYVSPDKSKSDASQN